MSEAVNTFAILVPALNEARTIGSLIDDILSQDLGDSLMLEKIVVVSDGSTDATNEIVATRAASDPRIQLIVNPRTLGQLQSENIGMRVVESDFLVMLDADVTLNGPRTLRNLLEGFDRSVGLVGGDVVPAGEDKTLTARVSRCGNMLSRNIQSRIGHGNSVYSAHGAILAMSRDLYSTIEIPVQRMERQMVSEDQYLYLRCIEEDMRFVYRGDAEVLHRFPDSFADYVRKSARFVTSLSETVDFFEGRDLAGEYHIPLRIKVLAFAELLRQDPVGALAWTAYRFFVRMVLLARRFGLHGRVGSIWEVTGPSSKRTAGPE